MTTKGFAAGMAVFMAAFPSLTPDKETLGLWMRLLDDIDDEAFLQGVIRLCREEKNIYPGTNVVALLRERCAGPGMTGIVALSRLEEAMAREGAYTSVVFDDPIMHLVVSRMGGWIRLCEMEHEEWKYLRRDFERLYDAARREPLPTGIPERLAGKIEITNNAGGYKDQPLSIAYIGNKAKALTWQAVTWNGVNVISEPNNRQAD